MQGNIIFTDFRIGQLKCNSLDSYIFGIQALNNKILICGAQNTEIRDLEGAFIQDINIGGVQTATSDGEYIFIGKEEEELQLWNFSHRKCLYNWDELANVTCVYYDGIEFLAGSIEGKVYQIL